MSNQKRIGLEGTIKAYAGCSRIIATIQRASSTERDHLGGVGGTRGRIHKTSCSVVISARRE